MFTTKFISVKRFFLFSVLLILGSCSGSDDGGYSKLANESHHIKIEMSISEPDVPVYVLSHAGPLYIKDKWEYEYDTKDFTTGFSGTVIEEENKTGRHVIIKASIYVDGKLKKDLCFRWISRNKNPNKRRMPSLGTFLL